MLQQEILKRLVDAFEAAGIEYMMTGSIVSSMQGEPRSTHDIDVVALITDSNLGSIISRFNHPGFFIDQDAAKEALRSRSSFNVIDLQSGYKIDIYILTRSPFDESRFARKYAEEAAGIRLMVSSPEDTILMKLHGSELSGGSEKQFTDALRVFEVQQGRLDLAYMDEWASKLGILPLWRRLRDESQI